MTAHSLRKNIFELPVIKADNHAAQNIPFFNDWVFHNKPNAYWQQIDGIDRAKKISAPVLLMAGWYDAFLPAQLQDFIDIKSFARDPVAKQSRLIIGPWAHARNISLPGTRKLPDFRKTALRHSLTWFDKQLLFRNHSVANKPTVLIYVMGDNKWRAENGWPLARTKYASYYLNAPTYQTDPFGQLTQESTLGGRDHQSFLYNPAKPVPSLGGTMLGPNAGVELQNQLIHRPDVLLYDTPVLSQDTEVTGPVTVNLFVVSSAISTDFTAKLIDVHPDGDSYNITDGIHRVHFGKDNLTPRNITKVSISLWPTSMVFKKNHKIRLEISSSNFPRFDRNLNLGRHNGLATAFQTAQQTIFYGGISASNIILPLVYEED